MNMFESLLAEKSDKGLRLSHLSSYVETAKLNHQYISDKFNEENKIKKSIYEPTKNLLIEKEDDRNALDVECVIDKKFQDLFNFPTFNKMQAKCIPILYRSDQNCVICAPTAAGKTVCFELAMARLLETQHAAKALYLAPSKSLVQERLRDWRKKLSNYKIQFQELSGDKDGILLENATFYIATPEKWDSVTRRSREYISGISSIKLILIDEVHFLDESRGPTLEMVVSRMKTLLDNPRFVALSASIRNIEDISEWLNATPESTFVFGEDYKPIKPNIHVLGFPNGKNDYLFDRILDNKLHQVIRQYGDGKPTIVFCSSRKFCVSAALKLLESVSQFGGSFVKTPAQKDRLFEAARKVQDDPKLASCILSGIAFHHAGLSVENRVLIENIFYTGEDLLVLTSTSTLAVGVNLPAYLVVIKSTSQWIPNKGVSEYSPSVISQMIGRAGRPQFGDTSAQAVIMTQIEKKYTYETISGKKCIESSLNQKLSDVIVAEVSTGTINNIEELLKWINSTFFSVRIKKNPLFYNAPKALLEHPLQTLPYLRAICMSTMAELQGMEIIEMSHDLMNIQPLEITKSLARNFISVDTLKSFRSAFLLHDHINPNSPSFEFDSSKKNQEPFNFILNKKQQASVKTILTVISNTNEVIGSSILRRTEKKELKEIGLTCRFPIKKVVNVSEKAMILLQAMIGRLEIEDSSLKQFAESTISTGIHILNCLSQFFLDHALFISLYRTLVLTKCLRKRMWENSPMIFTQLIATLSKEECYKLARRFQKFSQLKVHESILDPPISKNGIEFTQLRNHLKKREAEIEAIVGRVPPFGQKLVEAYCILPHVMLSARVIPSTCKENGLTLIITLRKCSNNSQLLKLSDDLSRFWVIIGHENKLIHHKVFFFPSIGQELKLATEIPFLLPENDNLYILDIFVISEYYIGIDIYASIEAKAYAGLNNVTATEYNFDAIDEETNEKRSKTGTFSAKDHQLAFKRKDPASPKTSNVYREKNDDFHVTSTCRHTCKDKRACKHSCCKNGKVLNAENIHDLQNNYMETKETTIAGVAMNRRKSLQHLNRELEIVDLSSNNSSQSVLHRCSGSESPGLPQLKQNEGLPSSESQPLSPPTKKYLFSPTIKNRIEYVSTKLDQYLTEDIPILTGQSNANEARFTLLKPLGLNSASSPPWTKSIHPWKPNNPRIQHHHSFAELQKNVIPNDQVISQIGNEKVGTGGNRQRWLPPTINRTSNTLSKIPQNLPQANSKNDEYLNNSSQKITQNFDIRQKTTKEYFGNLSPPKSESVVKLVNKIIPIKRFKYKEFSNMSNYTDRTRGDFDKNSYDWECNPFFNEP